MLGLHLVELPIGSRSRAARLRKGYACSIRLVSEVWLPIGERRPRPVGKFYRRRSSASHCTYSVVPSQVSSFIEIKM
jgi:hypothetical protein